MVEDDPRRFMPAYASPLTHDEHAALGRLAVLWGQVDFILDELLLDVIDLTIAQRATLVGDKPIGSKLEMLKKHLQQVTNAAAIPLLKRFAELIDETKSQRNHSFHGCWGWRVDQRRQKLSVGARHAKAVTNPVSPLMFPEIQKKLCECSRVGLDAVFLLRGRPSLPTSGRFFFGDTLLEVPKWLREWIRQNPLTDPIQDRTRSSS